MSKKKDTDTLSQEDIRLFRTAFKKIQPIKQDKVLLKKKIIPRQRSVDDFSDEVSGFYISDHSNEESVSPEQKLFFSRTGLSPKQIKKLKQGKIPISATLDLHGFDAQGAKQKLIEFLDFAYKNNKRCIIIIHGKGHIDKPILKNKINNWLKQFDTVLAFCTALPAHGGSGAVYVLLRAQHGLR